jgi:hypothetical protein
VRDFEGDFATLCFVDLPMINDVDVRDDVRDEKREGQRREGGKREGTTRKYVKKKRCGYRIGVGYRIRG